MPIQNDKPLTESQKFLLKVSRNPIHSEMLFSWIARQIRQLRTWLVIVGVFACIVGYIIGKGL